MDIRRVVWAGSCRCVRWRYRACIQKRPLLVIDRWRLGTKRVDKGFPYIVIGDFGPGRVCWNLYVQERLFSCDPKILCFRRARRGSAGLAAAWLFFAGCVWLFSWCVRALFTHRRCNTIHANIAPVLGCVTNMTTENTKRFLIVIQGRGGL